MIMIALILRYKYNSAYRIIGSGDLFFIYDISFKSNSCLTFMLAQGTVIFFQDVREFYEPLIKKLY